ncbi:MAG: hypothetical protein E7653_02575 [Ruminococcaceae bacterium]|nr:hypothetical protein [Oscillospiraceae bacterium]
MPRKPIGEKEKIKVESYLKTYALNKKLLRLEKYCRDFLADDIDDAEKHLMNEIPLARAKMFEVRHFILEMPNSDEKLFLYYHYIKEESTEKCADLLGISRRSAFRMRHRALELASERFNA